jgi:hypothetical protein
MTRGHRKYSSYPSYRKYRTPQEERLWLEEIRDRMQFRLSHQDECCIGSVRREEMELEEVLQDLRNLDGVDIS